MKNVTKKDNDEYMDRILAALRLDLPQCEAAHRAGISTFTFYCWKREGKKDIEEGRTDTRLAKFVKDLRSVEAECLEKHLGKINEASEEPRYWGAVAWLLERRYRKYFGKDAPEIEALTNRVDQLTELVSKAFNIKLNNEELQNGRKTQEMDSESN